jgi:hypothetical protein
MNKDLLDDNVIPWFCSGVFLLILCITIYQILETYWSHKRRMKEIEKEPKSTKDDDEDDED